MKVLENIFNTIYQTKSWGSFLETVPSTPRLCASEHCFSKNHSLTVKRLEELRAVAQLY